jgi:hypothetical protein
VAKALLKYDFLNMQFKALNSFKAKRTIFLET